MSDRGFTLTELMVATTIASILMAGVFGVFASQRRIHNGQRQALEMQQNLRAALGLLLAEIRTAGFDPTWIDADRNGRDDHRLADGIDNDCDGRTDGMNDAAEARDIAGIVEAGPHRIQLRLDRDGNADFCGSAELVAFGFSDTADRDRDGIADEGIARLNRGFKNRALNQPVSEGLQALAFAYAFDRDGPDGVPDGEIDTDDKEIIWAYDADGDGLLDTALDTDRNGIIEPADDTDGDGVLNDRRLVHPAPLESIRAVQVWLLGRTRTTAGSRADAGAWVVGRRVLKRAESGRHRQMLLTGVAVCRNLGLRRPL